MPSPNGWLSGRVVHPTNRDYNDAGSIHDDATAAALGFRGGTIAGSAHLDTFVPLAIASFGPRWFETGSISMNFRTPVTDGEPTLARFEEPFRRADAAASPTLAGGVTGGVTGAADWIGVAQVVTPEGGLIAEGTLGVGSPQSPTALASIDVRAPDEPLRILAKLAVGDAVPAVATRVDGERVARRSVAEILTEPIDWYSGPSPWGGPIAPPSAVIDLASQVMGGALLSRIGKSVGMWGALEVRFHHGPVLLDSDLDVSGFVCALSASPKTEIMWYDAVVASGGVKVATVRVQNRFVKASSALWSQ